MGETTVMIVILNFGFKRFFMNWAKFAQKFDWKFLVIALDKEGYNYYKEHSRFVFLGVDDNLSSGESDFTDHKGFTSILSMRVGIVSRILSLGYSVMHHDVDIGFYKDPFLDLYVGCDMMFQMNWPDCETIPIEMDNGKKKRVCRNLKSTYGNAEIIPNAGFYLFQPTENVIRIWQRIACSEKDDQMMVKKTITDGKEMIFVTNIKEESDKLKRNSTQASFCFFDQSKVSTGCMLYSGINITEETEMLHANCVIGLDNKMKFLNHYNLWNVFANEDEAEGKFEWAQMG